MIVIPSDVTMNTQKIKLFAPNTRGGKRSLCSPHSNRLSELLKLPPRGKLLLDAINNGFPIQALREVADHLTVNVYTIGTYINIKTATLNRRLRDGVLTADESDRLYRFIEVYDAALDLYDGDMRIVDQWLNSPAIGLGGESPLSVIRTSTGANDILSLIGKIEHGVLV